MEEMNAALQGGRRGADEGDPGYTEEPLVSMDLKGDTHSSILSGLDTIAIGTMVKIVAWYDNEWGYAVPRADSPVHRGEALAWTRPPYATSTAGQARACARRLQRALDATGAITDDTRIRAPRCPRSSTCSTRAHR